MREYNGENDGSIVDTRGIELVLHAMKTNVNDVNVQYNACALLYNLLLNDIENMRAIVDA